MNQVNLMFLIESGVGEHCCATTSSASLTGGPNTPMAEYSTDTVEATDAHLFHALHRDNMDALSCLLGGREYEIRTAVLQKGGVEAAACSLNCTEYIVVERERKVAGGREVERSCCVGVLCEANGGRGSVRVLRCCSV